MRQRPPSSFALLVAALSVSVAVTQVLSSPASAAPPTSIERAPDYSISGPATQLDATHYDFATDYQGRTISLLDSRVRVFAKNAQGNVAPERTINYTVPAGQFPQAVTVDGDGWIYLLTTDYAQPSAESTVLAFAPGASGAATPIAMTGAALGVDQPIDITDRGDLLAILDGGGGGAVYTFDVRGNDNTVVGGISNGSGTDTQVTGPTTLNSDASGRLVLVGEGLEGLWVGVFGAGANGNVAPVRYLEGANTGLDGSLGFAGFGPKGDVLVASENKVRRFAAGATGNVPPATTLTNPHGAPTAIRYMDVTSDGRIVSSVLDPTTFGLGALDFFTDIGPYLTPGKATKLKVAGKANAVKRKITWKPAAAHIDVPVTSQLLKISCKGPGQKPKKITKKMSATKKAYALKLGSFKQGTCKASVVATNAVGKGAAATKKFTVKRR
jgi:hypothetical protein